MGSVAAQYGRCLMLEIETVRMEVPTDANIILGQSHFIKTVEDVYEAVVTTVPQNLASPLKIWPRLLTRATIGKFSRTLRVPISQCRSQDRRYWIAPAGNC